MKIHFIGIDGISMSAIASIMQDRGNQISGSDLKKSLLTDKLIDKGAIFFNKQEATNIEQINPDIVVYTAAINKLNPELVAAQKSSAKVYDRAEFLGKLAKHYQKSIAISGSHGKTTTTAMVTSVLLKAGLDITALVGGELNEIQGNVKIGNSEIFITEACEYVESFLSLYPYIGVILNIDLDHLDYFRDIKHIIESFKKFSHNIKEHGYLIINSDDEYSHIITDDAKCKIISFGIDCPADLQAKSIKYRLGGSFSQIYYKNTYVGDLKLVIPGKHSLYNALSVLACCIALDKDLAIPLTSLSSFTGTHRRFEKKGHYKDSILIDDYAHHPKEVRATINAANSSYSPKKLTVVFQPHTYTRTKSLLEDFATSFNNADRVIITPTYAAREAYDKSADSKVLAKAISNHQKNVSYVDSYEAAALLLENTIEPGELIISMGAGPVDQVLDLLLKNQRN